MNSVVLIGRLTKDPEVKYKPENSMAIATFTIAVDRPFSKEKVADFLRVVVFGKQAENCERYLKKGSQVAVQGSIQTGSYETKTGEKRYTTDIVANRVQFLSGGSQEGQRPRTEFQQDESPFGGGIPDGFHALDDDDENIPF